MKRFDQILLVSNHVLLDGHFIFSRSVVVESNPALITALAQNLEERNKVNSPGAEQFVKVDPVVFLLAWRRTFPPADGIVFSLAVLQMYGGNASVVIAQALHRIDTAESRMARIEDHVDQLGI